MNLYSYKDGSNKYYLVHQNNDNTIVCNCSRRKECLHKKVTMDTLGLNRKKIFEERKENVMRANEKNRIVDVKCHSFRSIPVSYSCLIKKDLRIPQEHMAYYCDDEKFNAALFVQQFDLDYDRCTNCDCEMNKTNDNKTFEKAELFNVTYVIEVKCEYYQCKCGHRNHFDGLYHQVFNFNSHLLFHHNLLELFSMFQFDGMTNSSFVNIINMMYADNNQNKFVSKPTFRDVWSSYIRLQCWDNKFSCPWCGPTPKCIVADGTMLTLPKVASSNVLNPTVTSSTFPRKTEPFLGQYIKSNTFRLYYRRWTVSLLGYFVNDCVSYNL